jgi:hypothetical protein
MAVTVVSTAAATREAAVMRQVSLAAPAHWYDTARSVLFLLSRLSGGRVHVVLISKAIHMSYLQS